MNKILIPAIDILDGKVVRLLQGSYEQVTVYDNDPLETAKRLEEQGVRRIHIVDLDAARGQGKNNRAVLGSICKQSSCEIELGGGIRSREDVKQLLDQGLHYLIVGTALVKNPDEVASWISLAPQKFIAGIDAREGKVKVAGWEADAAMSDTDAVRLAASLGFSAVVYTSISRDGTLTGPDIDACLRIADEGKLGLIVSGGIGSMNDVHRVMDLSSAGIAGVIIGKAWYEDRIDLKELCDRYPQRQTTS